MCVKKDSVVSDPLLTFCKEKDLKKLRKEDQEHIEIPKLNFKVLTEVKRTISSYIETKPSFFL